MEKLQRGFKRNVWGREKTVLEKNPWIDGLMT